MKTQEVAGGTMARPRAVAAAVLAGIAISLSSSPLLGADGAQEEAPPPATNVWVDVTFYLVKNDDLRAVEKEVGFSLIPPGGRWALDAREADTLREALARSKGVALVAGGSLLAQSGSVARIQAAEEIRYVAEPFSTRFERNVAAWLESKSEEEGKEGSGRIPHVPPGSYFETRPVGFTLTVRAEPTADGKTVRLDLFSPELSRLVEWKAPSRGSFEQPVVSAVGYSATFSVPDRSCVPLVLSLPKGFDEPPKRTSPLPQPPEPKPAQPPTATPTPPQKSCLLLLSAAVVSAEEK